MVMIPPTYCPICNKVKNQHVNHSKCAKVMQLKWLEANSEDNLEKRRQQKLAIMRKQGVRGIG